MWASGRLQIPEHQPAVGMSLHAWHFAAIDDGGLGTEEWTCYTCYVCMSLDTKLLVNLSLPASCNGHLAATGLLFSWHTQLLADSDSQKSAAQIMRELANLGTQCKKKCWTNGTCNKTSYPSMAWLCLGIFKRYSLICHQLKHLWPKLLIARVNL